MIYGSEKYRIGDYCFSVLAFSQMGKGKIENQDSFKITCDGNRLIIAVADGLGSAAYSKEGAERIVDVAVKVLSSTDEYNQIGNEILNRWKEGLEGNINQYDTTLKFVKITQSEVTYGGIGDGWIAFLTKDGFISLTADNTFSNQTDSILSFSLKEKFVLLKVALDTVCSALVSTDGFSEDMDKDMGDKMLSDIGKQLASNEGAFIDEMCQTLENWPVASNQDDKTVVFINVTREEL